MMNWIKNNWVLLGFVLILPALLINLHLLTLNEDEAIRSLVALEMIYSGNFIVPTLTGDFYYSKPPLYNWILILFYKSFGVINEWSVRIPTILFLLSMAWSIYFFTKKYWSEKYAWINAFLFLTCGRILFWDSMLAYIDMAYSLVTFLNIMLIYHYYKKQNWWLFYLVSYFLAAVGFMLKGFPSILFLGLTLGITLLVEKKLKKLLHSAHFLGIGLFALIVGGYYFIYNHYNGLNDSLTALLDQSTRRTVAHDQNSILDTILHLFTYPFENLYHFFPWMLLLFLIIRKNLLKTLRAHPFIWFCAYAFGVNILVYWISVEVYPRYILMLVPLIFTILLYLYEMDRVQRPKIYKIFQVFFLGISILLALAPWMAFFLPQTQDTPFLYVKTLALIISLAGLAYLSFRMYNERMIFLILALIIFRIGFDWFVLPDRYKNDLASIYREQALSIGERYKYEDIRIYKNSKIDWTSSWYISKVREQITHHDHEIQDDVYYVLDTIKYDVPIEMDIIEEFTVREFHRTLFVLKRKLELD